MKALQISIQALYDFWRIMGGAVTPVVGSILHCHYINEICNIHIKQLFDREESVK